MQQSYLSRDTSAALKGIALVLMFIHHFFSYPEWYVSGVAYPRFAGIAQYSVAPLKLCIPLFAFLTGYFYYFTGRKNLRYSLRKITDLLIPHWAVCILMTLLAAVLGCYTITAHGFALEMMGLSGHVMKFSWYVAFYCVAMLLLPLMDKLSAGSPAGDILVLMVLPVAAVQCLVVTMEEQFHMDIMPVRTVLDNVREWLPCIVSGYLFARYDLFRTYFDRVTEKFPGNVGKALFWLCLCGIGMVGRLAMPRFRLGAIHPAGTWSELVFTMDILYAPVFVYGAARILELVRWRVVGKVLGAVGRQSMYMWFLHAVFFNVCREYTQRLVYFPGNPILVLILALAVCYGLAVLIDLAVRPVLRLKKKYL